MLHAMFQDNLTYGSVEEDFQRFWPYHIMDMAA